MILSKQKYEECIELYENRWKDEEFLKELDGQVDHGEMKDQAIRMRSIRYKIASEGAITFGKLKIYPTLRDCRKLKSSLPFVLLRLRALKGIPKGNEMQQARVTTLNGYIDTMLEVVEETLNGRDNKN